VRVTPGSSGATSVMTLTTDTSRTPDGSYTSTSTGVSSALKHFTQVQLTVTSKH
jgi:hypothetical protein